MSETGEIDPLLSEEVRVEWLVAEVDRPWWAHQVQDRFPRTGPIGPPETDRQLVAYTEAAPGQGEVTRRYFYLLPGDHDPQEEHNRSGSHPIDAVLVNSIAPGHQAIEPPLR
ncbi:hypothetical protein [Streptomyces sp. H27-D2]|uniref:hypothetical protein n=1 Tax=Streptomyces sp. H27-D2 TaxID=3046304 RepID=UPI002DC051F5|nr:hypothetical protein [Streptomyces sp. H27-D2]MEC4017590.1 hypothetical protein [Streptomyces sp. H27-D2]